LLDLAARRINIIFSVDLFNEGVDMPAIDTLLLLRPTDSATLFLQQLGRGLRRSIGKTVCTVLNFVGHHRKELDSTVVCGHSWAARAENWRNKSPPAFRSCRRLPHGVGSRRERDRPRQCPPRRAVAPGGEGGSAALSGGGAPTVTLAAYLNETGLELEEVYANNISWSDLCQTQV